MDLDTSCDVKRPAKSLPFAPISKKIVDSESLESRTTVPEASDLSYSTEEGEITEGHIVCDATDDVFVDHLTPRKLRSSSSLSFSSTSVEGAVGLSSTPPPCSDGLLNTAVVTSATRTPVKTKASSDLSPSALASSSPASTRRSTRIVRTRLSTRLNLSREPSPDSDAQQPSLPLCDFAASDMGHVDYEKGVSSISLNSPSISLSNQFQSRQTVVDDVQGKQGTIRRIESSQSDVHPEVPMILMDTSDTSTIDAGASDSIVLRLRRQSQARMTLLARETDTSRSNSRLSTTSASRTRLNARCAENDKALVVDPSSPTHNGNENVPASQPMPNVALTVRRQRSRTNVQGSSVPVGQSNQVMNTALSPYDLFDYGSLKASIHALRKESFIARYRPLLMELMTHSSNGGMFNSPVSPIELGIPDYFDVIKKPMDLGTIRLKLEAGEYLTTDELHSDVLLVFDNACMYNKPLNPVHIAAKKLKEDYLAKVQAIAVKESAEEKKKGGHNCGFCQGQQCALCGDKCLRFDADVISCDCCFDKIKRGESYFRASTGQRWCEKCISNGGANVEPGAILPPLALLKSASVASLEALMHHLGVSPGVVSAVAATAISLVLKHRTGNFQTTENAIRLAAGLKPSNPPQVTAVISSGALKKEHPCNAVTTDARPSVLVENADPLVQTRTALLPSPTVEPSGSISSSPGSVYSPHSLARHFVPSPPNMNPGLWNIILSAYAPYGSSQAMKATSDNRAWLAQQRQQVSGENSSTSNLADLSLKTAGQEQATSEFSTTMKVSAMELGASSPVSESTVSYPCVQFISKDSNSSLGSVDKDVGFSFSKIDPSISNHSLNASKKHIDVPSDEENPTEVDMDTSIGSLTVEPSLVSPTSTLAISAPGEDVQTPCAFSLTPFASAVRDMGTLKQTLEKNYTPKQLLAALSAAAVCPKTLANAAKDVYATFVSTDSVQKSALLKLSSLLRGRLEKRRNDSIMVEPWVQCDSCARWSHQICSLFNARKNSVVQPPGGYTCPICRLRKLETSRTSIPTSSPSNASAPMAAPASTVVDDTYASSGPSLLKERIENPIGISEAKDSPVRDGAVPFPTAASLPHTPLSEYLERQVRMKITQMASSLVASSITVRLVSSLPRTMQVPHDVRTIFTSKPLPPKKLFTRLGELEGKYGTADDAPDSPRATETTAPNSDEECTPLSYAAEYKYQQRVVLLWQRIDGIDVLLFALYVQEYDASNPHPNANKIYIAYLDSVRYLRPLNVRTVCYHGLLNAYLTHARSRGFDSAYIWSCPPQRGEGYIFHRHPRSQRTPDKIRLREWYDTMLQEMQDQGMVESVKSLFETHFDVVKCENLSDFSEVMTGSRTSDTKSDTGISQLLEHMDLDTNLYTSGETTDEDDCCYISEDDSSVGEKRKQSVDDTSVLKSARHGQNSTPSTPIPSSIPLAPMPCSRTNKSGKYGKNSKSKSSSSRAHTNQYEIVCLKEDKGLPPYFAGDFWACEMEKWIRDVHKRILSKITGKHAFRDTSAFYNRAKDSPSINTWTGESLEESDVESCRESTSPYASLVHSYLQTFPPTFVKDKYTFRVGEFEIPRHPVSSLAIRLRHMQKEIFVVRFTPLTTPLPPAIEANLPPFDPVYGDKGTADSTIAVGDTESVSCDFFDTRQGFLRMCQGNHYQFDTLRRAKHSSVMILWHLHNPRVPAYAHTCSRCECDLSFGNIVRWHCDVCYNFDICDRCHKQGIVHEHELTLFGQPRSLKNVKGPLPLNCTPIVSVP